MMRSVLLFVFTMMPAVIGAYPLDGDRETGITRLEGYRLAQQGKAHARKLRPGALLKISQVKLRLLNRVDLVLPEADEVFSKQIVKLLGKNADHYGIAVLDLSNPGQPVYAEHNATRHFHPGSVGKLAVAAGIFHALAKAWPDNIKARKKILKETVITADKFIRYDSHKVPFWYPKTGYVLQRKLRRGDKGNLWTYLDWMLSASSNASASMLIKNLMLLRHYGKAYPVSEKQSDAMFRKLKPAMLSRLMFTSLTDGLRASGLDTNRFRQGKFFTRYGKNRVAGGPSTATPRELVRFLLRIEQGKLVDKFSSLEMKRLLYLTQKRIRYASHPALYRSAVYFKSGSLYRCQQEPGYKCRKYRGNKVNILNSVAIIESPAGDNPAMFYMVVITSNVLKDNASLAHQTLAMRIHRLLQQRHRAAGVAGDKVVK